MITERELTNGEIKVGMDLHKSYYEREMFRTDGVPPNVKTILIHQGHYRTLLMEQRRRLAIQPVGGRA